MRALPHRHWSKQADGGAAHLVTNNNLSSDPLIKAHRLCRQAIKISFFPHARRRFHCGLDLLLSRCAILGRSGNGVAP